jgi:hypothetical protein
MADEHPDQRTLREPCACAAAVAAADVYGADLPGPERLVSRRNGWVSRAAAAAALIGMLAIAAPSGAETPPTVLVAPVDDLPAIVGASPPGSTFVLAAGVHRGHSVVPRDGDSYVGEPGAVMTGAVVLSGFAREAGHWVADAPVPPGAQHGSCVAGYDACSFPEDLFVDGEMLWQVSGASDLAAPYVSPPEAGGRSYLGSWYFERGKGRNKQPRIHVSFDPAGRTVELSVVRHAFSGAASAVTIRGLIVEMYAAPAQSGAIQGNLGTGWVIENNELRSNHGYGLRIGHGARASADLVHRNGQLGIGGVGDNVVIESNEIAHNNLAGFSVGWEAGGTKFVRTRDLFVRNNHVHHNEGPGLWTDIDNIYSVIEGNLVEWNSHEGIKHEISYDASIRSNTASNNGRAFDVWLWGAQIEIQNSSNTEVYANVVTVAADGGDGIAVINQSRGGGAYGPWVSTNAYVHDNEIAYLGEVGQTGAVDDTGGYACTAEANNRFDGNSYDIPSSESLRWAWCSSLTWTGFQAAGQEATGSVSSAPVPSGTVAGAVADAASGLPVAGAVVTSDTGQSAATEPDGSYALVDVPAGQRTLTATAAGFESQSDTVTVLDGETSAVDFALLPVALPSEVLVSLPEGLSGYSTNGGRDGLKHLTVTVELTDDLGGLVAGADVTVELRHDAGNGVIVTQVLSGTTDDSGRAEFSAQNAAAGCYSTVVVGVAATDLTWAGDTPANEYCK